MLLDKKMLCLMCTWLVASLASAGVVGVSDDFDTNSGTFSNWTSVGAVSTTIQYDSISAQDYDDGDPTIKLAYTSGMTITGDGLKDDGGLVLNSVDSTVGNEAIGLTLSGSMEQGEVIVFSGNVYNDNSSYSSYKAQLWNLTDDALLAESATTMVQGDGHVAYVPLDFSVTYTGTVSDVGDTLQIRIQEQNNHTARDVYLDNFSVTSTLSGTNVVYNHPRLLFTTNDLAELRAQRFTTHADEWSQLISTCNSLQGTTPTTTPRTASNLLGYEDKIVALALVQAIDPSQPYYATSKNWFMTILNWTEWGAGYWSWPNYGPRGNLETGEILRALAIWYDLQYDTLSEAEQIDASQKLADYADRFRNSYDRFWTTNNGELTGNHCWNAFSSLAAVLYASDHVSAARQTDWSALLDGHYNTMSNLMTTVMSDGATGEGMTYWTYGIEKVLLWLEMRRVAGKPAFDGIDWFKNTGLYGIYGIMPGGTDNYGGVSRYDDADQDFWGNPYNEIAILASAVRDPVAQWMSNKLDYSGSSKKNAYRYIFYDPTVPTVEPDKDLNNWHFFNNYGMFFWRDSWQNTSQHFTIRSGQHSHSHSKGDDGQFMLSRDGVPYIVNLGYERPRYAKDCNVLMVDGTGQYSDGDTYGGVLSDGWPGNSNIWGRTLHVLANDSDYQKGDFFNVLIDPTQMYTNADLTSWNREVVGLGGDLYLMRDTVAATKSVAFTLSLHGLTTTASGDTYAINATTNPWSTTGSGQWSLSPRSGKPALKVQDLSKDSWSASIQETWCDDKPEAVNLIRQGNQLVRTVTNSTASSLVSFGFSDLMTGWTQSAWTNSAAEGVHVTSSGASVIDVLWPLNGTSVSGSDGWNVAGQMAGRWFGTCFFGRDVTSIQYHGLDLLSATTPVSFDAKTEYLPGGTVPNRIKISATAPSTVTLYSPYEPKSVELDGASIDFAWTNNQVTFDVPATAASTVDLVDPAYLKWRDVHFSGADIAAGLSALDGDPDGDGRSNWQEYVADTDPQNNASSWDLYANNGTFSYGTSTGRLYTVEYRTNLMNGAWIPLSQGVPGSGIDESINDSNNFPHCYYRVKATLP